MEVLQLSSTRTSTLLISSFHCSPHHHKVFASSSPSCIRRSEGDQRSPWNSVTAPFLALLRSVGGYFCSMAAANELELFPDLVPSRIRRGLARRGEVKELIEAIMDLGWKPTARFLSGDWVVFEEPVKLEDLRHGIGKVWIGFVTLWSAIEAMV